MADPNDPEATTERGLRDRAEKIWQGRHGDLAAKSPQEILHLMEELQIHQIELELQNEELLDIQVELEDSRQQLRDLYDFAPVGYLTLDANSAIIHANLTLATMLGRERRRLIGQRFDRYVDRMSKLDFYTALRDENERWSGEITLCKSDRTLFPVSVEMARISGDVVSWRCAITDITTRKAAETAVRETAALRASENRYRGLAEQIVEGIFVADAGGRYLDANRAACEFLGYTLEELKALTVTDVVAAEELPRLPEQFERLRSGEIVRNEWRLRRKDGSVVAGELIARQLVDGRLQAVVRDITERKEAEELQRLLQQVAKLPPNANMPEVLERIVDTAVAIARADFGNIQLLAQPSSRLRIVAQRGFPQWWIDYWQDLPEDRGVCGTARKLGKRVIVEDVEQSPIFAGADLEKHRRAGVRAVQATPLFSRSGALVGMLSTHFSRPHRPDDRTLHMLDLLAREAADVIVHVQTETELQRQAALLDLAHDGILIFDRQGRITYWNDGAAQIYGWNKAEVLGLVAHTLLKTEFPEPLAHLLEIVIATGHWEGELIHTCRDGRRIPVDSRWTIQRDATGDGFRILQLNKDITSRKRLEEERAEEARRKDEFLAILGHELRNPLVAIDMAIQVLAGDASPEQRTRMEDIIGRQTTLMRRLVDDLLELERITHGHIELKLERLDLAECLKRSAAAVQSTIAGRNQELRLRLPSASVSFDADSTRFDQIVGNLLTNASKYTRQGGRIELSGEGDASEVIVRCKDNGQGILPEDQRRIFEPFARGRKTDLGFGEASVGLGLALVKQLTELHGGTISVDSRGVDLGSEFTVRLPITTDSRVPSLGEQPKVGRAAHRPRSIVIVEDNPSVAEALQALLQQAGHTVRVFADGASALDGMSQLKPDALVLDVGLPGMDGYELAAKLKQLESTRDALYVAVSGLRRDRSRQHDEFDHYFNKPPDIAALLAVLDKT